jgi:hypothetical protein
LSVSTFFSSLASMNGPFFDDLDTDLHSFSVASSQSSVVS